MEDWDWRGQQGGPQQPGCELIAGRAGWDALWRRLGRDAPAFDFARFVAAAAYAGERPTGGYALEMAPEADGDGLLVRCRLVAPAGFATQAFTRAWRVRAFPRPRGRAAAAWEPR